MDIETNLYKTKYWDYRLLNPNDCTLCFIYHYARIVPNYIDRLHDHVEVKSGSCPGKYLPVISRLDLRKPREWNNWKIAEKARRWCDQYGIKYEDFWNWACEEHEKAGWRMTFMNSFCGQKMLDRVKSRFDAKQEMAISRHEFFMAMGYKGCALQKEYLAHTVKHIGHKYGASAARVIKELISDGILPMEYFKR